MATNQPAIAGDKTRRPGIAVWVPIMVFAALIAVGVVTSAVHGQSDAGGGARTDRQPAATAIIQSVGTDAAATPVLEECSCGQHE